MGQEKIIYSRQQQKHDIEANWIKAVNFIPKEGEIIVYDAENSTTDLTGTSRTAPIPYPRIKIGDGITVVSLLPFTKGEKGDPGDDYVLTEIDKQEIANMIPNPNIFIVKLSTHDYQEFDSSHSYEDIVQAFNNKKIINLFLNEYVFVLDAQYSVVDGEALHFVSQVYSSDFESDMCAIRKLLFKSDNSIEFSGNPIYLTDIDTVASLIEETILGGAW